MVSATAFAGGGTAKETPERAQAIQAAKDAGVMATTVKGDKAMSWARAVKYSSVKPTKDKTGVRTFKAKSIECWSSKEATDEQLGDYKCTIDKRTVKDAAAFMLQTAMETAGVTSDDHMSQHTTTALSVSCTIDPAKTGDDRFACTFNQK
jgi:hypothetical protein